MKNILLFCGLVFCFLNSAYAQSDIVKSQENKQDHRENKQENRQDSRENKQENRQDRRENYKNFSLKV
jgi:uncharacterized membrane protein